MNQTQCDILVDCNNATHLTLAQLEASYQLIELGMWDENLEILHIFTAKTDVGHFGKWRACQIKTI